MKRTAVTAAAGSATPAAVQTPAPAAPSATQTWPPDQYTGLGGTYMRDPITGVRTPVPPAAPATGEDPQAASTADHTTV